LPRRVIFGLSFTVAKPSDIFEHQEGSIRGLNLADITHLKQRGAIFLKCFFNKSMSYLGSTKNQQLSDIIRWLKLQRIPGVWGKGEEKNRLPDEHSLELILSFPA